MRYVLLAVLAKIFAFFVCCNAQSPEDEEGAPGMQKMSFKPHKHSEEEELSENMPQNPRLRCDSCLIVSQIWAARFQKQMARKRRNLKESEYLQEIETTCQGFYALYGMKSVEKLGGPRFNGPGTAADSFPGVVQGGSVWQKRLKEACLGLIDEIDSEDAVYELFSKTMQSVGDMGEKQVYTVATQFVKNICLQKEEKPGKKKKRGSSYKVREQCDKVDFFMEERGFAQVVDSLQKDDTKPAEGAQQEL
eukprot:TRINITY_DN1153_c1_g1_i1.p1 TRINITY_DN1153_c1_g1~~TRINITY_DN1153_c1_g1_i1.p1  ORF type:complete len:249 (+),score=55.91 TRINITY_DN1153_c1_g1_i1:89-835(+)